MPSFRRFAAHHWPAARLLNLEMSEIGVADLGGALRAAEFRVSDLLEGPRDVAAYEHWATHAMCSEVLEHFADPLKLLRNAARRGCRLVVTAPEGLMSAFDRS